MAGPLDSSLPALRHKQTPSLTTRAVPAAMSLLPSDPSVSSLCSSLLWVLHVIRPALKSLLLFCILNSWVTVLNSNHTHNTWYTRGKNSFKVGFPMSPQSPSLSLSTIRRSNKINRYLVCAPEHLLLRQSGHKTGGGTSQAKQCTVSASWETRKEKEPTV